MYIAVGDVLAPVDTTLMAPPAVTAGRQNHSLQVSNLQSVHVDIGKILPAELELNWLFKIVRLLGVSA